MTPPPANRLAALVELAAVFLRLGLTSFGGPVAHLGYYHHEFVLRRKWLDEAHFADLVALCQFLPGPASSQVVFAIGLQRAGVLGGLVASAAFMLPSVVIMIGFAWGFTALDPTTAGWLHGLKLAAVAIVAHAVWGMGRRLCPDRLRISICLCAAAALLAFPGTLLQVGLIAGGMLVGWVLFRGDSPETSEANPVPALAATADPARRRVPVGAVLALVLFAVLLVALPIAARAVDQPLLAQFDSFYRAGSLVFGGGHVVLPLLRAEVVPPGWVSDDQFLAGYAMAQAIPGPLFTFTSYLGASMHPGPAAPLGGLWCLFAIYLPAWLLVGGTLPFWHRLRATAAARAALKGANAAVVGVLLAALYNPVLTTSVHAPADVAIVLLGFGLLQAWKAPAWLAVALFAATGALIGPPG